MTTGLLLVVPFSALLAFGFGADRSGEPRVSSSYSPVDPILAADPFLDADPAPAVEPVIRFHFPEGAGSAAPVPDPVRDERVAVARRILSLLGDRAPVDPDLDFELHPSAEEKALATGVSRWAHRDVETDRIHIVLAEGIRGDRLGTEAPALFHRALGPPSHPVLDTGLASFFSIEWGRKGFEYWAARLHSAGLVPPLSRILEPAWLTEESPLLTEPVAGALVGHLVGRWARAGFTERYPSWRPDAAEVAAMEEGWAAYLDALLHRHGDAIQAHFRDREEGRRSGLPPIRGVNFAHEGYQISDGYLSARSDASLERLTELGANGVAILPYVQMPSPDRPVPLRPPTRPGAENDEAVVQAVRTASTLGLTVLLKPHIWIRGSWPGEIRMASEGDWGRFFDHYERWMLHYALLAEIHDVPVLSLGVELSAATMGHEARWVELAARIRTVYSGALVYSANWGDELEGLGFWNAFDYIGVDAYYPLSEDPDASDEALRRGAEAMLSRIERVHRRFGKPVLFTEIGFASTRAAWVRPWEGHLVREVAGDDQLRGYRAVLEAMEGRDWIGGVFWWKWPADLRRAERDARGFTPVGKPAEQLLGSWFRGEPPGSWPRP